MMDVCPTCGSHMDGAQPCCGEWDMMDTASDGVYWRKEIDAALREPAQERK